jgi:hypothetical protein
MGGSFEQLVGAAGQRQWHANAERFGSLEVDVELYLSRLLNRQIGGLVAFENSSGLDSRHAIGFPFSFATQADSDGHGAPPKIDIDSQLATRRERRRRTSPWPIRRVWFREQNGGR